WRRGPERLRRQRAARSGTPSAWPRRPALLLPCHARRRRPRRGEGGRHAADARTPRRTQAGMKIPTRPVGRLASIRSVRYPLRSPPMRLSLCLVLLLPAGIRAQDSWPQFRGRSAGVASELKLRGDLAPLWTTPLHELGRGWSSPIVWKDRVYL